MKNYQETMKILEKAYAERVGYWKKQNSSTPEVNAASDIFHLEDNPYAPKGDTLDSFAKVDFLRDLRF